MVLKFHQNQTVDFDKVMIALSIEFAATRFDMAPSVSLIYPGRKYCGSISLPQFRMKQRREYCGHHLGPCPGFRREPKRDFLEGMEWLEVDDRINDVLDLLNLSANCYGVEGYIRKDFRRRIRYFSPSGYGFGFMSRHGSVFDYENWCGKIAPASEIQDGTPGTYARPDYAVEPALGCAIL